MNRYWKKELFLASTAGYITNFCNNFNAIYEDKQSRVQITKINRIIERLKHVDIKCHYIINKIRKVFSEIRKLNLLSFAKIHVTLHFS